MADIHPAQRFADQLPYLLNGTLDDNEAAWMTDYLQNHPEAQQEWALAMSLRQASLVTEDPSANELRWQSLRPHLANVETAPAARALWQRLWNWRLPAPAIVSVCLAVAIGMLWWPTVETPSQPESRALEVTPASIATPCQQQWRARVVFGEQVSVQEAVIQIRAAGASRISLPTQLGEWWLYWTTEEDKRLGLKSLQEGQMTASLLVPSMQTDIGCIR